MEDHFEITILWPSRQGQSIGLLRGGWVLRLFSPSGNYHSIYEDRNKVFSTLLTDPAGNNAQHLLTDQGLDFMTLAEGCNFLATLIY